MIVSKSTYLVVLIVVFLALPIAAQIPLDQIEKGFKIGTGIGTVSDYSYNAKSRMGYLAGLYMNIGKEKLFSFQLELLFVSKGYMVDDAPVRDSGEVIGTIDFDVFINGLEMPLLAKIAPPLRGKYRPYAVVGGFATYNLVSKIRLKQDIPYEFDLDNAADVDYGVIAGIGVDITAGTGKVLLEARYDISLAETVKDENQKLRFLSFQIGYGW
jgi:hypothetical protein